MTSQQNSLLAQTAPHVATVQPLLTVAEVARLLAVSEAWVRDHSNGRRRPQLQSVKMGKVRRYRMSDVMEFIRQCQQIA